MSGRITVLRCLGTRCFATKRFYRIDGKLQKVGHSAGMWFTGEILDVENLREFAETVRKLSRDPKCLIVRGAPIIGTDLRRMRRLKRAPDATLADCAERWIPVATSIRYLSVMRDFCSGALACE